MNLTAHLLDRPHSKVTVKKLKHIYFMGVCGTAMASLAVYLKKQGFVVSGSDQGIYPPMSVVLKKAGVLVFPYHPDNIKKSIDLIVVGNVISLGHEEIQKAKQWEIPVISFPEFLQQSLLKAPKKNIVITGTHGKSSCSALMAWTAKRAYQPTDFFVGAQLNNFKSSLQITGSKFSVVEGDEYDSSFFAKKAKFLYYNPYYALLTGIEFDHGDIYKDLEHIKDSFRQFVCSLPKTGLLVACAESPHAIEVSSYSSAPVLTYGIAKGDYKMQRRSSTSKAQTFEILCSDRLPVTVNLPLLGEHNALNAMGVFILARHLNWPEKKILSAFKTFKGLSRRLDFKGEFQGAKIFEDFAHHPTAIKAGLLALKESQPHKRLVALFEPHSFTSHLKLFQKDYVDSFESADLVFLAKAYKLDKIPKEQRLSMDQLLKDLKKRGKQAHVFKNWSGMERALKKELKKGDLAVLMSSGNFGGLLQKLLPSKNKNIPPLS